MHKSPRLVKILSEYRATDDHDGHDLRITVTSLPEGVLDAITDLVYQAVIKQLEQSGVVVTVEDEQNFRVKH